MAARWCVIVLVALAAPFAIPQDSQRVKPSPQAPGNNAVAQPPASSAAPATGQGDSNPKPVPEAPPPPSLPESEDNSSPPVSLGALTRFQGLRVSDVRLQTPVQLHPDALQEILEQKKGEPFDKNKVKRTIQALYQTGRFSDVEAQAQRQPDNEVSLVFIGRENYFIGFITVDGVKKEPTPEELANTTKLQLGELFTADSIQRGTDRIKQLMQENGYYQSAVTADREPHPNTQQVDIHFHVVPGPRARIGNITVEGTPAYSPAEIRSIAHFHPGDHVSRTGLTKALERLRKKYQKTGHLEAQVSITDRVYRPESNVVDYTFKITRGPSVGVTVEGAKLSKSKLKRLVPVYEENAVDEDLLNEGKRNILDYFQTKGYFDVAVTWDRRLSQNGDHMDVTYVVTLGEKHKLVEVAANGNRYFPDDLVKDRLIVQPSAPLLPHGRYSQSAMERDREAIEALYHDSGFQQVKVTAEVQDNYEGEKGRMRVQYNIEEGPQTLVGHLAITGATTFQADRLEGLVNSTDGQPFSEQSISNDRDSLTSFYFNRGFPDVRVDAEVKEVPGQPDRRDVVYNVSEGNRQYVDRVLLSGLYFTKPFVVKREFTVWDGDPLSQTRQLDTQRRLYDLGIFNEVNMAVQNPEGNAEYKNLLVQFDEAKRYTFNYGVGFEAQTGLGVTSCPGPSDSPTVQRCEAERAASNTIGFSPRVSFDVSRINFRGRNHTISLKSHYGRLTQRGTLSYEAPRWFDRENLKLTFTGLYDASHEIFTFKSQRLEGSAQIEQTWSRITKTLYRFNYRLVKASEIPCSVSSTPDCPSSGATLSLTQIPLLALPVRVGMPSFTYLRDKRDNPLESTRGNFTSGDFGVASGIFGSQANFTRAFIENSTYVPFRFAGGLWVFARLTRVGVEQPFGSGLNVSPPAGAPNVACNPALNGGSLEGCNSVIPLPERFFAGGGSSLRGFPLNQAGPRDPVSGDPVGGAGLFVNMLELRMPPPNLPFVGNNLSFVLFEDAGNVFASASDVWSSLVRWHQTDVAGCQAASLPTATGTCNFNYLSHAVGMGVRYRTPVGPVRFDLGYNLNPPYFAERDLNCPTGTTCPPDQPSPFRRLGHFNFYFSVGQTF